MKTYSTHRVIAKVLKQLGVKRTHVESNLNPLIAWLEQECVKQGLTKLKIKPDHSNLRCALLEISMKVELKKCSKCGEMLNTENCEIKTNEMGL